MRSAIDDIAFLANSANRVAVLRSIEDGPHSRHVILEETDVSRVTLGRILDELEEHCWIVRRGQVCDITPIGAWVLEAFNSFEAMMESARGLERVVQWFPPEGFGFHISRLADAEITLVDRADATAPIATIAQQFDTGGDIRAFSFAITSQTLDACWRNVMDGHITWQWVFTSSVLSVLKANPTMAEQSREMLESGRAHYRTVEGEIPYVVVLTDDCVNIRLADDGGAATALLQVDEPAVRGWADRMFRQYWDAGTPVGPETFTG